MACSVLWDPSVELNVMWKKDNVDIETEAEDRMSIGENNELVIENLKFEDAGKTANCCFFLSRRNMCFYSENVFLSDLSR